MCVTVHRNVHMNTCTCMATFIEAPQPKCPLQTSLSPLEDKEGGLSSSSLQTLPTNPVSQEGFCVDHVALQR